MQELITKCSVHIVQNTAEKKGSARISCSAVRGSNEDHNVELEADAPAVPTSWQGLKVMYGNLKHKNLRLTRTARTSGMGTSSHIYALGIKLACIEKS